MKKTRGRPKGSKNKPEVTMSETDYKAQAEVLKLMLDSERTIFVQTNNALRNALAKERSRVEELEAAVLRMAVKS